MPESKDKFVTIRLPDPWKLLLIIFCAITLINLFYTYNLYQRFAGTAFLPSEGQQPQPTATTTITTTQTEQDPFSLLSAQARGLVEKYQVQGTPTLVINCKYERVGSMAVAESSGSIPVGSEQQDLINDFCQAAGDSSVFCKDKKELNATNKIEMDQTNETDCGTAGKVELYVFHSPTCPFCEQQEPILKVLKQKYGDAIELTYVCTPIHGAGDVTLCKQQSSKYTIV